MKTLLQSLLFFLLVTPICFGQWEWQNPLPQGNTLHKISFYDEQKGIAVGDAGTIIRTTDGGDNWVTVKSGTNEQLIAIYYQDQNTIIVVGESGLIIKSIDGGSTWTIKTYGTLEGIKDAAFPDKNNWWIIGRKKIFKTTDSGENWIEQASDSLSKWWEATGIYFINADKGWVVGATDSAGKVIRTTDGGISWNLQNVLAPNISNLNGVYFTDESHGWLFGSCFLDEQIGNARGIIYRTTDGGENWTFEWINELIGDQMFESNVVHFISNQVGWIASGSVILKTTDGGIGWTTQTSGTDDRLNNSFFINDTKGWMVGNNGIIINTEDGGSLWQSPVKRITNNLNDAVFVNKYMGLAIGDSGKILRTTTGGTNWTPVISGISNKFTGMCFADENEGWAVTGGEFYGYYSDYIPDSSFIFHTTDGGVSWINQLTKPLDIFNDVTFIDSENGWAVGFIEDSAFNYVKTIILRTTNGGTTWNQRLIDSIPPYIKKVDFVDLSTGWIVSARGTIMLDVSRSNIYKTTDGGITWANQYGGYFLINDISFNDLNNCIAVGSCWNSGSLIIKTTDGGASWTETLLDYPELKSVFLTSSAEGIAVGEGGVILRTSDGGISWEEQVSNTKNTLNSVYFVDALNGWVVGENGTILHTTNGGVTFIQEEKDTAVPNEFLLSQNYPNPFNPSTKIKYSVPQTSTVQIKVFDVLGNEVATLVNEEKPVGTYELNWNAAELPSGVYFYQLKAGDYLQTKKMILLK